MREITAEAAPASQLHTVADLLVHRVTFAPDAIAFQKLEAPIQTPEGAEASSGTKDGVWAPISTLDCDNDVRDVARGFLAAGLESGDPVAIMAPTSYEWFVAEMACAYAALVVVPIYETSSPAQIRAILMDASVKAVITADERGQSRVCEAVGAVHSELLGVWIFSNIPRVGATDPDALVLNQELERRRQGLRPEDLATIVYTSGTTSAPKGVLLTHGDLVEKVLSVAGAFPEIVHENGSTVILLPLAHILARGLQLCCLYAGMRISHVSKPREALPALKTLQPTFLVMVPQVLQKILSAGDAKAANLHVSSLWNRAKKVAIEWGKYRVALQDNPTLKPPAGLAYRRRFYDLLFYRAVRAQMGGKIDYLLSGGSALDSELNVLFLGMGIPIVEGYGLTESTAPLAANRVGDLRPGTVGTVMPGVTIRIADDGEVLVKGCGITSGYRNRSHNKEAFTDGFFRTGDVGELDEWDHLALRGRVKDVLVTSYGETVFPEEWEQEIENHPLVSYGIMLGESRKYVAAMVFVDHNTLTQWAAKHSISLSDALATPPTAGELVAVDLPELHHEISSGVDKANSFYSHAQSVKRFVVVTADVRAGGELVTPTMKLKRTKVLKLGKPIIEALYAQGH